MRKSCLWCERVSRLVFAAGLCLFSGFGLPIMEALGAENSYSINAAQEANRAYEEKLFWESLRGSNRPQSLRELFDPDFYAFNYPDAVLEVGWDPDALFLHFLSKGIFRGYLCNPYLDILRYRNDHPEFEFIYGNDWNLWLLGFYETEIDAAGKNETKGSAFSGAPATGIDSDDSDDSRVFWDYKDSDRGIISDGKGNILVPISEISEYLTLDELREKCGPDLVLVMNEDGFVTFVGGHFSDVQVSDQYDSVKAIHCMLELIGFSEGKILKFSQSVKDSMGNVYYQFTEGDKANTTNNYLSSVSLGVDTSGNVLSLSSNCGAKLQEGMGNGAGVTNEDIRVYLQKRNEIPVYEQPERVFLPYFNDYLDVFYGRDEYGYINKYLRDTNDGTVYYQGRYTEVPTEKNGAVAFEYLFSDDVKTEEHSFKTLFGQDVTLTVASFERGGEKYYYLVDKKRRIAANVQDLVNGDYFNKGFTSLDEIYTHYVQDFVNLQKAYDFYKELGIIDDDFKKPFILSFQENDKTKNAGFVTIVEDFISIGFNNNETSATFDSMGHELGHALLSNYAPPSKYLKENTIDESYADILGNIMEILLHLKGDETIGKDIDLDTWKMGESIGEPFRSMGDPESMMNPSKVGGMHYAIINFDYWNSHDHASILGNICYRMNKELGIPLDDLFLIWYDSMPNITSRSTYRDIKGIITYSSKLHGYEDSAEAVSRLFDEANVEGYSDNWTKLKAAEGYEVYVPVIIDDYNDIFDPFLEGENNYLGAVTEEYRKYAYSDEDGNIGIIIREGQNAPEYTRIYCNYNGEPYFFRVNSSASAEPAHIYSADILWALSSCGTGVKNPGGNVAINYELTAPNDGAYEYYLYRILEDGDKHEPVYFGLVSAPDFPLSLMDNAEYGISRRSKDGKMEQVTTFNTKDFREGSNPYIRLTENLNAEHGMDVESGYGNGTGNMTTLAASAETGMKQSVSMSAPASEAKIVSEAPEESTDGIMPENDDSKPSDITGGQSENAIVSEDTENPEAEEEAEASGESDSSEAKEDQKSSEGYSDSTVSTKTDSDVQSETIVESGCSEAEEKNEASEGAEDSYDQKEKGIIDEAETTGNSDDLQGMAAPEESTNEIMPENDGGASSDVSGEQSETPAVPEKSEDAAGSEVSKEADTDNAA